MVVSAWYCRLVEPNNLFKEKGKKVPLAQVLTKRNMANIRTKLVKGKPAQLVVAVKTA